MITPDEKTTLSTTKVPRPHIAVRAIDSAGRKVAHQARGERS